MKSISLIFLLSILILSCGKSTSSSQSTPAESDSLELPSKIKVTDDSEPGEPMIISGTVYLPDGKTPVRDAILSVWQTDAKGYYIEGGGGAGELHPRIRARIKT